MKKILFSLVLLLITHLMILAKTTLDPITGDKIVETKKSKLVSYSTVNILGTQRYFLGTPTIYYQFTFKDNKKYLLIEYTPAYLATSKNVDRWLSDPDNKVVDDIDTYKIEKADKLWIKLGNEVIQLEAENDSFADKRGVLPFVYYDITSLDLSEELISFIRTDIKYGQTSGELNAEVKKSAAKKFSKDYISFNKEILD